MVYRETFLEIQMRHHQHLVRKNCINGIRPTSRSIRPQWKRVKGKNKIKIRDASLDRQPKIQSSSVWETLQRIMGQTNNDFRFRIFIPTNSLHQLPLLVGRQDSRPNNSRRKLCNGSKKWRWLIQWILRHQYEVIQCRTLKYLMRGTKSSIILHFKKNQSGGTEGPEAGPFPSRQTDCLPDLRILPGHWSP